MTKTKDDVNESWLSNLIFLRENHFQRNLIELWTDSILLKCLIFVSSFQNSDVRSFGYNEGSKAKSSFHLENDILRPENICIHFSILDLKLSIDRIMC